MSRDTRQILISKHQAISKLTLLNYQTNCHVERSRTNKSSCHSDLFEFFRCLKLQIRNSNFVLRILIVELLFS